MAKKWDRIDSCWNPQILQNNDIDGLVISCITFEEIPAELGKLPNLKNLEFSNCKIGHFDPEVFRALNAPGFVDVRLKCCEFDEKALFDEILAHGSGRWRFAIGYEADPSFKLLTQLGDEGDEAFRRQCYSLLDNGRYLPNALPQVAGNEQLLMLNHSKKPLRELALRYLENALPNPLAQKPFNADAALLLLGKPSYHTLDELKEKITKKGFSVVTVPAKATHAVVLDKPGDKLQKALAAGLPCLLEAHLKAVLEAGAVPVSPPTAKEAQGLEVLLVSSDLANVRLAVQMLKSLPVPKELLETAVSVMLFVPDNDVRKEMQLVLFAQHPEIARYFQGDNRAYHKITDGAKLWKLTRDLNAGLGLDPARFALELVRMFANFQDPIYHHEALSVALRYPENARPAFSYLAGQTSVALNNVKKELPPGMGQLLKLEELRLRGTELKSGANLVELSTLPNLVKLEYWLHPAGDLRLLDPIKHQIKDLEFSGNFSELSDISVLAGWTRLERLKLSSTYVTDIAPLASLSSLTCLIISDTKVASLAPLKDLKGLRYLYLSRVPAKDLSVLAELPNLESLDLSFLDVGDLCFLKGAQKLTSLNISGATVSGLEAIVDLPITSIDFCYSKPPDLAPLERMKNLQRLSIIRQEIDEVAVQRLRQALPKVAISH